MDAATREPGSPSKSPSGPPVQRHRTRKSVDATSAISHECLRGNPLFADRGRYFLEYLISYFEIELYPAGAEIMKAGDTGEKCYLLHRGMVEVLTPAMQPVATLHSGAFFGELALFGAGKRTATIRALEFCDCRAIHHHHFHSILRKFRTERQYFEKIAAERLAQLREKSGLQAGATAGDASADASGSSDEEFVEIKEAACGKARRKPSPQVPDQRVVHGVVPLELDQGPRAMGANAPDTVLLVIPRYLEKALESGDTPPNSTLLPRDLTDKCKAQSELCSPGTLQDFDVVQRRRSSTAGDMTEMLPAQTEELGSRPISQQNSRGQSANEAALRLLMDVPQPPRASPCWAPAGPPPFRRRSYQQPPAPPQPSQAAPRPHSMSRRESCEEPTSRRPSGLLGVPSPHRHRALLGPLTTGTCSPARTPRGPRWSSERSEGNTAHLLPLLGDSQVSTPVLSPVERLKRDNAELRSRVQCLRSQVVR